MNYSSKEPNKRILVVDDEVDVLEFLEIYLSSLDWEIVAVDSTTKAFEELKQTAFFLIISDIAMPEMDGYEFASALRDHCDSEMIFMTGFGYNPNHTLVKINHQSKYPCLFKPFNRQKLSDSVMCAWTAYHEDLPEAPSVESGT